MGNKAAQLAAGQGGNRSTGGEPQRSGVSSSRSGPRTSPAQPVAAPWRGGHHPGPAEAVHPPRTFRAPAPGRSPDRDGASPAPQVATRSTGPRRAPAVGRARSSPAMPCSGRGRQRRQIRPGGWWEWRAHGLRLGELQGVGGPCRPRRPQSNHHPRFDPEAVGGAHQELVGADPGDGPWPGAGQRRLACPRHRRFRSSGGPSESLPLGAPASPGAPAGRPPARSAAPRPRLIVGRQSELLRAEVPCSRGRRFPRADRPRP